MTFIEHIQKDTIEYLKNNQIEHYKNQPDSIQ